MAKSYHMPKPYTRKKGTHTDKVPTQIPHKCCNKHSHNGIALWIGLGVIALFLGAFMLEHQSLRLDRLELDNQMQQHMANDAKQKLDNLCTHFKTGCTEKYKGR